MALPTTANTSNPQGFGFGARLDDLLLRLAEAPGRELVIQDAEMEADRVNTAQTPEAYLSAFGDVFARSAFWGGEGLLWAHRRDNLANHEARFWDSSRIDISPPRDRLNTGIGLSPEVASLGETWDQFNYYGHKDAGHNGSLVWSDHRGIEKLYIGRKATANNPGTYRVSTDPLASSPTFSTEDPYAGEAVNTGIHSTTFVGNDAYAGLRQNGIHRDQGADGSWSHWNDLDADIVWGLKRRILARGGGVAGESLYEVTSGGAAPAALKTLGPNIDWQDATDGGEAILACATDGGIYAFALNDNDALVLQGETHLPYEVPDAIHATRGLVFYVTRRRENDVDGDKYVATLWRAELDGASMTLVNQQLIRTWERDQVEGLPYMIAEGNDALFLSVEDEGATSTSLWRYDLSTGAVSRHLVFPNADYLGGITFADGRILVMKDTASGDGNTTQNELFREEAAYASSGYLIGPAGDLFTADDKSWVTAKMDATDLPGNGEQVDFYLTTNLDALDDPNHADWVLVKSYTSPDDSEITVSRFSRYIAGMVKLTPSTDGTNTPVVRSFAFRSYPPPGDILVDLPVNVSDQISSAGRRPRRVPGRGKEVFNELLSRSGREATLELYRHGITVTGLVERVSVPSPEVGKAGSPTAHAMLRFRGRKATLVQV